MSEPVKPKPPKPPKKPSLDRPKPVKPINKTKLHLTQLLRYIDEKQAVWNMNEGEYLEVTEMLKDAFNSV
jgi:hypothetical protein